ncbi:MAG: hypothetical protein JWN01_907 [Patescibacteria group bacterium]|nr:hypothetical protein [Patescibacteria group bacterium]
MTIIYWQTSRNSSPITDFILSDPNAGARVQRVIDHLEEQGLGLLGSNELAPMNQKHTYELRIKYNRVEYRIIAIIFKDTAYLLHAFKKNQRKTPKQDLLTADKRRARAMQELGIK